MASDFHSTALQAEGVRDLYELDSDWLREARPAAVFTQV